MNTFRKIFAYFFLSASLLAPVFISAQIGGVPPASTPVVPSNTIVSLSIGNPLKCGTKPDCNIMDLIVAILNNIVMPIAAVAVTVWIIWAGFQFILAQGNPKKIDDAKQQLLWSLIGAGVLLGAAGISVVVRNTVDALIK